MTKQTNTFGVNGFRRKKKDENDNEYAAGLATAVAKYQVETVTYLMGSGLMGFERQSDGEMFYFLTDGLQSVRDVVDDVGDVKASYEFSEYGERIATFENGASTSKTYVGGLSVQDEVADTGLMLMGHRFYEPSGPLGGIGRFLNRDPIGFAGGLNLFSYGDNNPVTYTDHTGLEPSFSDYSEIRTRADRMIKEQEPVPVHVFVLEGAVPVDDLEVFAAMTFFFPGRMPKGSVPLTGEIRQIGAGRVINLGSKGTVAEQKFAQRLADRGFSVETRFGSNCVKGIPDLIIEGSIKVELKTITGSGAVGRTRALRALESAIQRNEAKKVILDMTSQSVSLTEATEIVSRAGGTKWFARLEGVWIATKDADYIWKLYP